jgi:hypothetical protein
MARIQTTLVFTVQTLGTATVNYQHAVSGSAPSSALLGTMAQNVFAAAVADANITKLIGSGSRIASVRMNYYPSNVAPATASGVSSGAPVAGTGINSTPAQCAVVVTLRSSIPGRSHRGRLYWPAEGQAFTAGGQLSSTVQGLYNTGAQAFSHKIVTEMAAQSISASWCVYSPTLGILTPLSSISVGSRIDTQRRRLDAFPDTYANFPLT